MRSFFIFDESAGVWTTGILKFHLKSKKSITNMHIISAKLSLPKAYLTG